MTQTSEVQIQTEQPESAAPAKPSSRKSILALSVFALGLNASAAVYTLSPSDFALPDVSHLAELLPQPKASDPVPDAVLATLSEIQSAQQQHIASLQENSSLLQKNSALLQQDSISLASLRQSLVEGNADVKKISTQITDEHEDLKKMSAKISTLIAKVDTLQNAMAPQITSSIPTRSRPSRVVVRKKMARQPGAVGPVSVGGVPLSFPGTTPSPQG